MVAPRARSGSKTSPASAAGHERPERGTNATPPSAVVVFERSCAPGDAGNGLRGDGPHATITLYGHAISRNGA